MPARLIYAALDKKSEKRLAEEDERPETVFLPVASRAGSLRFAVLLGRAGRYQLQLLAQTPASYQLTMADPSVPIGEEQEASGNLPVGGATFYSFTASPGELFHVDLGSQKFVPLLRLYDARGIVVEQNSAGSDDLASRITHMVVQKGLYRLQVSSLGDGGGGDFRLALTKIKLKELAVGGRGEGTLQSGRTDFWSFAGKEGQTVFLNARSAVCDPVISLRARTAWNWRTTIAAAQRPAACWPSSFPRRDVTRSGSHRGTGQARTRCGSSTATSAYLICRSRPHRQPDLGGIVGRQRGGRPLSNGLWAVCPDRGLPPQTPRHRCR